MIEYDEIIDSIRLDEVLDALGINVIQISKGEHWASCELPTHPGSDASPSFSVNEDTLLYNCFVCGGGPLPLLVAEMEGFENDIVSTRWEKAVEWLLPYSDGETTSDESFLKQIDAYTDRALVKMSRERRAELPFFSPRILDRWDDAPLELLAKWHITDAAVVREHQIKYDPEHHRISPKGEYTGPALIIPHFFEGRLVGYQERWLDDERGKWPPKYTNTDDFPKSETVYGFDQATVASRAGEPISVVESTLTKVRLAQLGYPAVAVFGASVNSSQIRLLRSFLSGVILALDTSDPDFFDKQGKLRRGAGVVNTEKLADALTDFIPVWNLPPVAQDKGDLADIEEEVVRDLYSRKRAVFQKLGRTRG